MKIKSGGAYNLVDFKLNDKNYNICFMKNCWSCDNGSFDLFITAPDILKYRKLFKTYTELLKEIEI